MICANCQISNRDEARYCRRCGWWLEANCPFCNSALPYGVFFCDHCGRQLAVTAAPTLAQAPAPIPALQVSPPVPQPKQESSAPRSTPSLEQLIPESFAQELEAARDSKSMVGERRVVTMLFCDVKGSTAAAEQLDPEEWTEIMNGVYEYMIGPVYTYEGTVGRLMGDAVLAFFGAPIAHEDDPQRAVLAGLDIVSGIQPYRDKVWREWGLEIDVRVGINTGMVVVGAVGSDMHLEYTALGDAVNLAARMEQAAAPGTVQISHDTFRLVRHFFEFEALGGISVKGKEDPVLSYRVLSRKTVAGRQRGIEGLQAEMVGRDLELAALREKMISLQQGVGHIVAIIGEAGLGKSRLISEIHQTAEAMSIDWFETSSLSYETTQPYGLFQRLLRRLHGIGPGDSREMMQTSLESLLALFDTEEQAQIQRVFATLFDLEIGDGEKRLEGEAFRQAFFETMPLVWQRKFAGHPAVLVFDDIHWSDPASIELLLHLLPATAETPLVLICAFRPDRHSPTWQLKIRADEDFRHRYTEINLRPLSDAQVNEMINRLLAIAELPESLRMRILERASGNPFFVEEVVRSLIDSDAVVSEDRAIDGEIRRYWRASGNSAGIDIPDNLQSLLTARIDRLEEETRQVMQMAAVIGRSFYKRILQGIGDDGSAAEIEKQLNALLRLEMIRESARVPELEYKFSNPLTQEAAYQTILLKRRREFHQRVGEVMESLFPDQATELAPRLAYHFGEARIVQKTFGYYLVAGNAAARLYANAEAVAHFARALDYVDRIEHDTEKLTDFFNRYGRALELLNRDEEALQVYETMLQLAQRRNDRHLELAALMAQATLRSITTRVRDIEKSRQLSEQALALAQELGSGADEAKIHWNIMLYHMWGAFNIAPAIEHGEASLALARAYDLTDQLAYTLNDLGSAYLSSGRMVEAAEAFAEAEGYLRAMNDLPLLALNVQNAGVLAFLNGENKAATRFISEALAIGQSHGNVWAEAQAVFNLGYVAKMQGEWGAAYDRFVRQMKLSEDAEIMGLTLSAYLSLAVYCLDISASAEGLAYCQSAIELSGTGWMQLAFLPRGVMALHHLLADDLVAAREAMEISLASFDRNLPIHPLLSVADVWQAEAKLLLAEGRPEEALARADDFLAYLDRLTIRQFRPDALLLKGRTLLALDRLDEAEAVLADARSLAVEINAQPALWQILAALAEVRTGWGDTERADELRDEARGIVNALAASIAEELHRRSFLGRAEVARLIAGDGEEGLDRGNGVEEE